MSLPLRTSLFWSIYRRVEPRMPMQRGADEVRRASNRQKKLLALPPSKIITWRTSRDVTAENTTMRTADGAELLLRVYRPKTAKDTPPVIVNFHGGGWATGDVYQSEWWASTVAALSGSVVVSVGYRLAPESPFPGPVEDCYAGLVWVHDHAAELGVDPTRIATMGDSAGGNLAAVVPMVSRDRGGPAVGLQILIYPSVALEGEFPSEAENASAPILGKKDLDNVPLLYFYGVDADKRDPYASPLYGKHEGLPPALIQTAQYDPLRDQGFAYADALRAAGIAVRHTNYVGAVHGYVSLPGIAPYANQAVAEAAHAVRETFGS